MKKMLALLLTLVMVLSFVACTAEEPAETEGNEESETVVETEATEEVAPVEVDYAGYVAAAMDTKVIVEAYVQATQSWWDNKITVYAQDKDGAYFVYEMACSEEDSEKLIPGTKIRITGVKGEWSGEVEILDATFEFIEDADTYIAEPIDATALLGTDELIEKQNQLAVFKGLTIKKIEYKNGEPGDDIYVTVTADEKDYSFCVERYLTDPETDTYKAFADLKEGDVVDITGFIYWYEGVNTHITAVTKAAA